jgi:hypothetical protein
VRALAHQVALRDPVTHLSTLKRTRADGSASAITALIDPNFLQEMGWDSVRLLLFPPEGHRLLTRPVCVSEGCSATSAGRVNGGSTTLNSATRRPFHCPLRPGGGGEDPANAR